MPTASRGSPSKNCKFAAVFTWMASAGVAGTSGLRSCYFNSSSQMLPVISAYSYAIKLPSGDQSG